MGSKKCETGFTCESCESNYECGILNMCKDILLAQQNKKCEKTSQIISQVKLKLEATGYAYPQGNMTCSLKGKNKEIMNMSQEIIEQYKKL